MGARAPGPSMPIRARAIPCPEPRARAKAREWPEIQNTLGPRSRAIPGHPGPGTRRTAETPPTLNPAGITIGRPGLTLNPNCWSRNVGDRGISWRGAKVDIRFPSLKSRCPLKFDLGLRGCVGMCWGVGDEMGYDGMRGSGVRRARWPPPGGGGGARGAVADGSCRAMPGAGASRARACMIMHGIAWAPMGHHDPNHPMWSSTAPGPPRTVRLIGGIRSYSVSFKFISL